MDSLRGSEDLWKALTALPNLRELADLAYRREGFIDSELGTGVMYHREIEQLAEFDHMADDDNIPIGHVQVFVGWGPPSGYHLVVREREYLDTLASVLDWAGFAAEAKQVQSVSQ